jgi:hypothetical protein
MKSRRYSFGLHISDSCKMNQVVFYTYIKPFLYHCKVSEKTLKKGLRAGKKIILLNKLHKWRKNCYICKTDT